MKHASRIEAEKKVAVASLTMKRAEQGGDESVYLAAHSSWKSALADLVAVEIAYPTVKELSRKNSRIRLENRGLVG